MPRRKFTIPMSIVLFIAFTLVGTYLVRKSMLEQTMVIAMEMGDVGEMQRLLVCWPCPVNARDERGQTPLHWAVLNRNVRLAGALLDAGADTEAFYGPLRDRPDAFSVFVFESVTGTPLHWAVFGGHHGLVRLLIARGADVDALTRDDYGSDSEGYTPLELSVEDGDQISVADLLKSGADVEGAGHESHWPLMLAAREGRTAIIKMLLDHGANLQRTGVDGYTALHHAAALEEPTAAKVLLERGANTAARDSQGNTPLHLTALNGYTGCAGLLLKHGADVTLRNKDGKTPLMLAEGEWDPSRSRSIFGPSPGERQAVAELLRKHVAKE